MSFEKNLFEVSKRDLSAACVLYKNRKYRYSLFHFQESVEKANKVFGLIAGVIKREELQKDIGHNSIRIYRKGLAARKKEIEETLAIINSFPKKWEHEFPGELKEHYKNMLAGQKFLDGFNPDKLMRLNYDELYYCIDQLTDIANTKISVPEGSEWFDKGMRQHLTMYDAIGTEKALEKKSELEMELKNPVNKQEAIDAIKIMWTRIIEVAFINYTLYLCAIITLPHALNMKTRYPAIDSQFDPLIFYTKRLPLIDLLPEFMKLMRKALKMIPGLFTELT